MPKPVKKPSQPRVRTLPAKDENQLAHALVQRFSTPATPAASQEPPLNFETQYKAHMAKLGKKGGEISGAKRMTNLSDSARSDIAFRAATARWDRERAKKKK